MTFIVKIFTLRWLKKHVLGTLQMFVSHHSSQTPVFKLPWCHEEYPLTKFVLLFVLLSLSLGDLGLDWTAAVSTSTGVAFPLGVCAAQSLGTTLIMEILWWHTYTKHLKWSICLFEEFLLSGTDKVVLNVGLHTQQVQPLRTSQLPLPFSLSAPKSSSLLLTSLQWCDVLTGYWWKYAW